MSLLSTPVLDAYIARSVMTRSRDWERAAVDGQTPTNLSTMSTILRVVGLTKVDRHETVTATSGSVAKQVLERQASFATLSARKSSFLRGLMKGRGSWLRNNTISVYP